MQPNWMYTVNKREAEKGNPQAVNWMNSLPPIQSKPAGWTQAAQSGFTPASGYQAPAGRPQYIQAQRYTNPARPAYTPPPATPQAKVVYQMMQNKTPGVAQLNGYSPPNPQASLPGYSAPAQAVLPGFSPTLGGGPGHR